jgi:hypothetical protein
LILELARVEEEESPDRLILKLLARAEEEEESFDGWDLESILYFCWELNFLVCN